MCMSHPVANPSDPALARISRLTVFWNGPGQIFSLVLTLGTSKMIPQIDEFGSDSSPITHRNRLRLEQR